MAPLHTELFQAVRNRLTALNRAVRTTADGDRASSVHRTPQPPKGGDRPASFAAWMERAEAARQADDYAEAASALRRARAMADAGDLPAWQLYLRAAFPATLAAHRGGAAELPELPAGARIALFIERGANHRAVTDVIGGGFDIRMFITHGFQPEETAESGGGPTLMSLRSVIPANAPELLPDLADATGRAEALGGILRDLLAPEIPADLLAAAMPGVTQRIEDLVFNTLYDMRCMRRALADGRYDVVAFAVRDGKGIFDLLPQIETQFPGDRIILAGTHRSLAAAEQVAARLAGRRPPRPAAAHPAGPLGGGQPIAPLPRPLPMPPEPYVLALTRSHHSHFRDTVRAVMSALPESIGALVVDATVGPRGTVHEQLSALDGPRRHFETLRYHDGESFAARGIWPTGLCGRVVAAIEGDPRFQDVLRGASGPLDDTVTWILNGLARHVVPAQLQAAATFLEHFRNWPPAAVLICPGRDALAWTAAEAARACGIPSVEAQVMFVSSTARLKRPRTDRLAVLDTFARTMFADQTGMDPNCIRVTGWPRLTAFTRQVAAADGHSVRHEVGVPASCRHLICYATQPIAMERSLRVLRALGEALAAIPDGHLIVKLHPAEDAGRVQDYRACIAGLEAADRVRLVHQADIAGLVAASDVIVTVYSNVGLEAAVAGKRVVVPRLDEGPVPVPLDELGIGFGVRSEAALIDCMRRLATDSSFGATVDAHQRGYFDRNPHLTGTDAAAAIAALLTPDSPA